MSDNSIKCKFCQSSDLERIEVEILKCGHIICWSCLANYIDSNLDSKIRCPINDCNTNINDAIIRKALPNNRIYDYELKSFSKIEQIYKCLLTNCDNIVFYTAKEIQFECTICSMFNCISCEATHPLISCKQYQNMKISALTNQRDKEYLETMDKNERKRANEVLLQVKHQQTVSNDQELESHGILPNDETFTCLICCKIIPKGLGVKLRNCCHVFCRNCLNDNIKNSVNIPVQCLHGNCNSKIQDREIREILNERDIEVFQEKCLIVAKSKLENIFHCKTPDCKYFGICDPDLENFVCPICHSLNCIMCNVIHKDNQTCAEFQHSKGDASFVDDMSIKYIEKEIKDGKCMKCTTCGCLIKKAGGCNWIKCPQCKLELCWILKIPRWGPKGKGDISGGCRCGVNEKPCHPTCKTGCIPDDD